MLLAQTVLVLPIVIALVRQVVEDADAAHGEQLRSLGAGPRLRSLLLAWDERSALLTVALAAFGRAIAEVGAVMLVGGNMDGFTRVMTTAIALETSKGDLPLAMGLGLVLLGVVLLLQLLLAGSAGVAAEGGCRCAGSCHPFRRERAHERSKPDPSGQGVGRADSAPRRSAGAGWR